MFLKMETTEYRAVIKFYVKEGLTPYEFIQDLLQRMGTLLFHFQQLKNGLPSLNVVVPADPHEVCPKT